MLPTGFSWRHYINGPGLHLGDRLVANAVQPSEGALWRLTYGVRENIPNTKFFSCEYAAKRYAEAWAVKWEARLRAWYTVQVALRERPPESRGNLPTPEMVAKKYARRAGRRTKDWRKQVSEGINREATAAGASQAPPDCTGEAN